MALAKLQREWVIIRIQGHPCILNIYAIPHRHRQILMC